jgi:hypothetical protein
MFGLVFACSLTTLNPSKHYFAYDLGELFSSISGCLHRSCRVCVDCGTENWGGVTRDYFDAIVSPQDETETYLVAFQSCVERGNASGIMCSYVSTVVQPLPCTISMPRI